MSGSGLKKAFCSTESPVRALAGEMAQLFFDGQRVVPNRLTEAGYTFHYPTLDAALRDLA